MGLPHQDISRLQQSTREELRRLDDFDGFLAAQIGSVRAEMQKIRAEMNDSTSSSRV